jgi:hypothetical protein
VTLGAEVGKLARHLGESLLEVPSALLEHLSPARHFLLARTLELIFTLETRASPVTAAATRATAAASTTAPRAALDVVSSHRLHHGSPP